MPVFSVLCLWRIVTFLITAPYNFSYLLTYWVWVWMLGAINELNASHKSKDDRFQASDDAATRGLQTNSSDSDESRLTNSSKLVFRSARVHAFVFFHHTCRQIYTHPADFVL